MQNVLKNKRYYVFSEYSKLVQKEHNRRNDLVGKRVLRNVSKDYRCKVKPNGMRIFRKQCRGMTLGFITKPRQRKKERKAR